MSTHFSCPGSQCNNSVTVYSSRPSPHLQCIQADKNINFKIIPPEIIAHFQHICMHAHIRELITDLNPWALVE